MLGSISIFIIPCQVPWLPILSEVAHLFNICGLLVIKCHHLACITWGKGDIISSIPALFQPQTVPMSAQTSWWCSCPSPEDFWRPQWMVCFLGLPVEHNPLMGPLASHLFLHAHFLVFLFILLPHARVTETFLLYSALAIPFSRFLKAPLQFVSSPRVFATVLNPVPPESAPNSMNSWLYSLIFQPLWSSNLKIQLQDTLLASVCIC